LIRLIVTMKKSHAPTTTSRSSEIAGNIRTSQKASLKVCHLADIHLGYRKYQKLSKTGANQRELDVALAFRESIDRIIGLSPNLVIMAGDIFHQVRPTNAAVTFAFKELRRLSSGIGAPIILIAGNHESPKRSDTGCILRLFEEIKGVFVADTKTEQFRFEDISLSVTAVPHAALDTLKPDTLRADDNYSYNILTVHGQIGDSWMSEFGGIERKLSDLNPHEWDYIALGHIHIPKQIDLNAWFSGAIENTSSNIWSEADQNKGFLEVFLPEQKVTFHSLSSPREVVSLPPIFGGSIATVEDLSGKLLDAIASVSGGVDGKIIRLELLDVPREIFRQLDQKLFRETRLKALHLQIDLRYSERAHHEKARSALIPTSYSLKEELATFVRKNQAKPHVTHDEMIVLFDDLFTSIEAKNETR
jgi:exonuclease SbcD